MYIYIYTKMAAVKGNNTGIDTRLYSNEKKFYKEFLSLEIVQRVKNRKRWNRKCDC